MVTNLLQTNKLTNNNMARFLQDRSCNDDFVPILRITRSTCEPNRLEQASYVPTDNTNYNPYPDANIYFKEKKNILSWEADPRLEAIDARLEQICAEEEARMNGAEDDIIREDFLDDRIRDEDFDLHYYHNHAISYLTEIKNKIKKQGAHQ